MRAARFSILVVEGRHQEAGLVATDLFRRTKVWLVDMGLESSLPERAMIATRLFTPEQFPMDAGAHVPFDPAMLEDLSAALPRRLGQRELIDLINDRRFAEVIYRVALAGGVMDRIAYQDLPDDD
jgi:hypothetical protein